MSRQARNNFESHPCSDNYFVSYKNEWDLVSFQILYQTINQINLLSSRSVSKFNKFKQFFK